MGLWRAYWGRDKGVIMEFSEGTPYMTNKEWLLTLDDEVLANLILDGLQSKKD